uniref:Uncharacterized protein n=2 Tax=Xiphophorus TaxID=8082 RepID=A0A3B5Q851_XIPMA
MLTVPDLRGSPPSEAVSTSVCVSSFSRSRAFCKTISMNVPPSGWFCTSNLKWSKGFKTYL